METLPEWLETDGTGGYACSTLTGLDQRRYHGLLVAATAPPAGRSVLLSKLEETLVVAGERFDLSANRYGPGVLHPRGDRHLLSFRHDPFPMWVYAAGGVRIERTFFLVNGESTAVVTWEVREAPTGPLCLEVRPLVAFRDHHHLRREAAGWNGGFATEPGRATVRPVAGLPALSFAHDAERLSPECFWYRGFELEIERERGFDWVEDLLSPFALSFDLSTRRRATLVVTTGGRAATDAPMLRAREEARRAAVAGPGPDPLVRALRRAADQFLVRRGDGWTVLAGYPWFTDWGRDTMIALPGLTLATGRLDIARGLLETFAAHVDRGMIPNRFPDAGDTPEYNTVDGTLWLFAAVQAYLAASGDDTFAREITPLLVSIVDAHLSGTRFGIRADADGLLLAGGGDVALTWMDAKVGGRPVTPRHGKPVEVQALWHEALRVTANLTRARGDLSTAARLDGLADSVRGSFHRLFRNEATGTLHDVVGPGSAPDRACRPNQLLALSLPHPLVTGARAARVLDAVERQLLTPYGLRTLARSHPAYRGRYEGDGAARDGAYHQGTAWPWLLGPLVDAHRAVHGDTDTARERAARWLEPLSAHLLGPGLGQLPEVFDGEAPQRPGGCIAQAWSVGELLRSLTRIGRP